MSEIRVPCLRSDLIQLTVPDNVCFSVTGPALRQIFTKEILRTELNICNDYPELGCPIFMLNHAEGYAGLCPKGNFVRIGKISKDHDLKDASKKAIV